MHLINPEYGLNTAAEYLGLSTWCVISPGILTNEHFYTSLSLNISLSKGKCISGKMKSQVFSETLTSKKLPQIINDPHGQFVTNCVVHLSNGDKCPVGQCAIVQRHEIFATGMVPKGDSYLTCVQEILQRIGSSNYINSQPDGLLLQSVQSKITPDHFLMPQLEF